MNTHDKYALPPLPTPSPLREHRSDYSAGEMQAYALAAIKAERERILNCIEAEFHIALSKYEDSRDHYWDGSASAFYKAGQIVKGEIR